MSNCAIGKYMKQARERKGWSQKQLADALGITQQAVSALESDTKSSVTLSAVMKYSEALNCSPLELCPFFSNEPATVSIDYINERLARALVLETEAVKKYRWSDAAEAHAIVQELTCIIKKNRTA